MKLLLLSIGLMIASLIINPTIKQPTVSITFDDGLISQYQINEMLDEYDYKATFYVITGINEFEENPLMNKSQLIELNNKGHEIACHTHTHPNMTELSCEEVINELNSCLTELSDFNPVSFAYPYGQGIEHELLIKEKFTSAKTTIQGINTDKEFNYKTLILVSDRFSERMQWLNDWLEQDGWISISIHGITENPRGLIDITHEQFNQVLETLKKHNAKVITVKEHYEN